MPSAGASCATAIYLPRLAIGVSSYNAPRRSARSRRPLPEHLDALVDFALLALGTHAPSRAAPTAARAEAGAAVVGA